MNSWPTIAAPEGANAFVPSGIILAATREPMPLKLSRRDLLGDPDEDKSS